MGRGSYKTVGSWRESSYTPTKVREGGGGGGALAIRNGGGGDTKGFGVVYRSFSHADGGGGWLKREKFWTPDFSAPSPLPVINALSLMNKKKLNKKL